MRISESQWRLSNEEVLEASLFLSYAIDCLLFRKTGDKYRYIRTMRKYFIYATDDYALLTV